MSERPLAGLLSNGKGASPNRCGSLRCPGAEAARSRSFCSVRTGPGRRTGAPPARSPGHAGRRPAQPPPRDRALDFPRNMAGTQGGCASFLIRPGTDRPVWIRLGTGTPVWPLLVRRPELRLLDLVEEHRQGAVEDRALARLGQWVQNSWRPKVNLSARCRSPDAGLALRSRSSALSPDTGPSTRTEGSP
jgi:hypothetical protein